MMKMNVFASFNKTKIKKVLLGHGESKGLIKQIVIYALFSWYGLYLLISTT